MGIHKSNNRAKFAEKQSMATTKINYPLILCLLLLVFCLSYLVAHLIKHHLYIDAAFAVAVPVLFGLMIHFIRRDNNKTK